MWEMRYLPEYIAEIIIAVVIAAVAMPGSAQVHLDHVVIADKSTGEPIPYATLVSLSSSIGFVSDELGKIDSIHFEEADSLEARSIGYESIRFPATSMNSLDIDLKPKILELNEVVIRPINASRYVLQALAEVATNYYEDSFATTNYFLERLTENRKLLLNTEAFLETVHPDYQATKDSFEIHMIASRSASKDKLEFMQKERDKDARKEIKAAAKDGEVLTAEELEFAFELGHPAYILYLDPLRHPKRSIQVNEDNIDFLDSLNHEDYEFWHGKPVAFGSQSLVVIHFDQREKVKRLMLTGTLWIDQDTKAFVKIAFGLSKKGEKHLIPTYAKAALWVYGLSYELYDAWVEFDYRTLNDRWLLSSVRLKADLFLEKRRLFSENEKGRFKYACEMITSQHFALPYTFKSPTHFKPEERLSEQLLDVSDSKWKELQQNRSSYR